MDKRQRQIYALVDPRTNAPRYVGKSSEDKTFSRHLKSAVNPTTNKARWIAVLLKLGMKPEYRILESSTEWSVSEQNAREVFWIAHFGRTPSGPLLNMTNGGDGGDTMSGRTWSAQRHQSQKEWTEKSRANGHLAEIANRRSILTLGTPSPWKGKNKPRGPNKIKKPRKKFSENCIVCAAPIQEYRKKTCGKHECRSQALKVHLSKVKCKICGLVAKSKAGERLHYHRVHLKIAEARRNQK